MKAKNTQTILTLMLSVFFVSGLAYSEPLFQYNGRSYTKSDISPAVRQALYEVELETYESVKHWIDEEILDRYFEQEAAKRKIGVDEIRNEKLTAKPPTKKEIEDWYNANKDRIPYPLDKVKKEVSRMLSAEKSKEVRAKLVAQLKKKGKFSSKLKKPVAPTFTIKSEGFPSKGPKNAKVTVVEFADYQCPHCKRASGMVRDMMKKYGKKVRLVFLDFPINSSGISRKVAEGAVCADEQKKYWAYHDMAFEKQLELSDSSPESFAKSLGLNVSKFKKCMGSPSTKEKVVRAEKEGRRIGVRGTPTFYLNGRKISVADEKQLSNEIDQALKGKKS